MSKATRSSNANRCTKVKATRSTKAKVKAKVKSKYYLYYLPKLDLLVPLTVAPPPIPLDCNEYFEMTYNNSTDGSLILLAKCVYYIGEI